jgi:hypothetical protein
MRIEFHKLDDCACREVWQPYKYVDTIPCAYHMPYLYQERAYVTPYGWFKSVWTREGFGYHVVLADGREFYTWLRTIVVPAIRDGSMQPKDEEFCYSPEEWQAKYMRGANV